jgi:hypothetical protein
LNKLGLPASVVVGLAALSGLTVVQANMRQTSQIAPVLTFV